MGNRDVEVLLAVKSGDTVKYQRLWDRLTQYADSLALALFSSPTLRDDAVEKAMDKAEDWLKSDGILYIDRPWAYVRRIVSNSLIDSSRTRKLEEVNLTSVRDTADRDILSEVDEEIRKALVKSDDGEIEDDTQGSGWQVFQIISEGKVLKKDDDSYHPHRWIETLNELFKYEWWWNIVAWGNKVESKRKTAMQSLRGTFKEARSCYDECTSKLWGNYHLITALIDNIQRFSERRIMSAYLQGFKQVEISRNLNISEAFVSKVVNNYLKEWEWGDPDIYTARLILFTQHLAVLYRNFARDIEKAKGEYWKGSPIMKQSSSISYIHAYYEENFYNKVINSIGDKAYFSDLEKGDIIALDDTCGRLWGRWYGPLNRLTF